MDTPTTEAALLLCIYKAMFKEAQGLDLPEGKRPVDFDVYIDCMLNFDGKNITVTFCDSDATIEYKDEGPTFYDACLRIWEQLRPNEPVSGPERLEPDNG